ncbi:MAG: hypothetical protein LC750_08970 [Actinobacteria bacterium]|nr:hypothetical protein [Actinomycetota bacterium]
MATPSTAGGSAAVAPAPAAAPTLDCSGGLVGTVCSTAGEALILAQQCLPRTTTAASAQTSAELDCGTLIGDALAAVGQVVDECLGARGTSSATAANTVELDCRALIDEVTGILVGLLNNCFPGVIPGDFQGESTATLSLDCAGLIADVKALVVAVVNNCFPGTIRDDNPATTNLVLDCAAFIAQVKAIVDEVVTFAGECADRRNETCRAAVDTVLELVRRLMAAIDGCVKFAVGSPCATALGTAQALAATVLLLANDCAALASNSPCTTVVTQLKVLVDQDGPCHVWDANGNVYGRGIERLQDAVLAHTCVAIQKGDWLQSETVEVPGNHTLTGAAGWQSVLHATSHPWDKTDWLTTDAEGHLRAMALVKQCSQSSLGSKCPSDALNQPALITNFTIDGGNTHNHLPGSATANEPDGVHVGIQGPSMVVDAMHVTNARCDGMQAYESELFAKPDDQIQQFVRDNFRLTTVIKNSLFENNGDECVKVFAPPGGAIYVEKVTGSETARVEILNNVIQNNAGPAVAIFRSNGYMGNTPSVPLDTTTAAAASGGGRIAGNVIRDNQLNADIKCDEAGTKCNRSDAAIELIDSSGWVIEGNTIEQPDLHDVKQDCRAPHRPTIDVPPHTSAILICARTAPADGTQVYGNVLSSPGYGVLLTGPSATLGVEDRRPLNSAIYSNELQLGTTPCLEYLPTGAAAQPILPPPVMPASGNDWRGNGCQGSGDLLSNPLGIDQPTYFQ